MQIDHFSYIISIYIYNLFVSFVTVLEIKRSENYDNAFLNVSSRRSLKLTSLELIKMLKRYKFVHFKLVSFRGKYLMPTYVRHRYLLGIFLKISEDHPRLRYMGTLPSINLHLNLK